MHFGRNSLEKLSSQLVYFLFAFFWLNNLFAGLIDCFHVLNIIKVIQRVQAIWHILSDFFTHFSGRFTFSWISLVAFSFLNNLFQNKETRSLGKVWIALFQKLNKWDKKLAWKRRIVSTPLDDLRGCLRAAYNFIPFTNNKNVKHDCENELRHPSPLPVEHRYLPP